MLFRSRKYDADCDDDYNDAGDTEVELTQQDKGALEYDARTNIISIPVGVEYKPVDWVALRFGANHTITMTRNIQKAEVTDDGLLKTVTKTGTGTTQTEVTTYGNTATRFEGAPDTKTTARATTLQFGIGVSPTENTSIDLSANYVPGTAAGFTNYMLSTTVRY